MSLGDSKQAVREHVWSTLIEAGVCPDDARGHIPNFIGSDRAAQLLASTNAWRHSRTLKTNPDKAQLPVRARVLTDRKILCMAVPRLAIAEPFFLIDPMNPAFLPSESGSSAVATQVSPRVRINEMPHIDLVVSGSVAVNHQGVRLGKGAGYADIEIGLLIEAGLITDNTVIATTVHSLQVLDQLLPEQQHDCRVDLIVTEQEIIKCPRSPRPPGLIWPTLSAEQIAAIPVLNAKRSR